MTSQGVDAEAKLQDKSERMAVFIAAMDYYPSAFNGIDELLAQVAPHAVELDGPEMLANALSDAIRKVPVEERPRVIEVLEPLLQPDSFDAKKLLLAVLTEFFDKRWGARFFNALKEVLNRHPRTTILLNSLLTHVVSTFEFHLGDVAASLYRAAPRALDACSRDAEFSLADLNELGSIDEARDLAIARRVDRLSRGNLAEWRRHFKDSLNVDMMDLAIDWASVVEIVQRRNAIVHHDARVSAQYLRNTGRTDVSLGDDLACDINYLQAALDELLVVGFLLSIECVAKFDKEGSFAANRLHQFEDAILETGRWRLLEKVCSHGMRHKGSSHGDHVFRINVWLARKRMYGLDCIRAEVDAWDVSALDPVLVLAKACLLDDLDYVFAEVPTLVDRGSLTGAEVMSWPMFEESRADARFALFKDSILRSVVKAAGNSSGYLVSPTSKLYHRTGCARVGGSAVLASTQEVEGRSPAKCCIAGSGPN